MPQSVDYPTLAKTITALTERAMAKIEPKEE